jgi:hypothetical protein
MPETMGVHTPRSANHMNSYGLGTSKSPSPSNLLGAGYPIPNYVFIYKFAKLGDTMFISLKGVVLINLERRCQCTMPEVGEAHATHRMLTLPLSCLSCLSIYTFPEHSTCGNGCNIGDASPCTQVLYNKLHKCHTMFVKNDLVCIVVHVFVYLIHNIRVVGFCVLFIILIYFVLQIPSNLSIVFVHPWPLLTSPEVKTPLSILHVPITGTTNKYSDTYRTMSHI